MWISILAALVLLFSFIGGLKDGSVKSFFSLVAIIIAIPIAGVSYHILVNILSFLPGENWSNFIGFFATMGLLIIALHFVFFLPRKFIQKVWHKGLLFRLIGGAFNIFNAAIGIVIFTLVFRAYPVFGWLEQVVVGAGVFTWLVGHLSFVQILLPELFQHATTTW